MSKTRHAIIVAATLALGAGVAVPTHTSATSLAARAHAVKQIQATTVNGTLAFSPKKVTIKVGTKVVWTNPSPAHRHRQGPLDLQQAASPGWENQLRLQEARHLPLLLYDPSLHDGNDRRQEVSAALIRSSPVRMRSSEVAKDSRTWVSQSRPKPMPGVTATPWRSRRRESSVPLNPVPEMLG